MQNFIAHMEARNMWRSFIIILEPKSYQNRLFDWRQNYSSTLSSTTPNLTSQTNIDLRNRADD